MHRISRLGRRGLAAAASVVALVIVVAVWFLFVRGATPIAVTPSPSASASAEPTPTSSPSPSLSPTPDTRVACPLNGLPVDDPSLIERVAIAVQIENNPLARPTRNLSNADMVVEAPVEGDTTRFSAIFVCRPTAGLTGPIRSARYYEVDLWQDLGVLPVGFGASNGALARFAAAGMPYVNGITGAWPWFQRHGSNPAPHNLYGNLEALRDAIGGGGAIDRLVAKVHPLRPPFTFDATAVLPAGRPVHAVVIRTNSYWQFGWTYDETDGRWTRQEAGTTAIDEVTGEPLTAMNIIVQRVQEEVVLGDPDPGGNPRRLQHLVGQGNGVLYSGGRAIALHWSRPTAADGTHWTYADSGAPVVLPPGVVWWEIVPIGASVAES